MAAFTAGDLVRVRSGTDDAERVSRTIGIPAGGAEVVEAFEVLGTERVRVRGSKGEFVFLADRFEKAV